MSVDNEVVTVPLVLIWPIVVGLSLTTAGVVLSIRQRSVVQTRGSRSGLVWSEAHRLGTAVALSDRSAAMPLRQLIATTDRPLLVAAALGVVAREHGDGASPTLFEIAADAAVVDLIQAQMFTSDRLERIEALELVAALRIQELLGDVALLADDTDVAIARAAVDALIELNPATACAVLSRLSTMRIDPSLADWTVSARARAEEADRAAGTKLVVIGNRIVVLDPARRGDFDERTVTDLAVRVASPELDVVAAALDELVAAIRLPAARLVLAGALGSPHRSTRYAAAASLSCSEHGRALLASVAQTGDFDEVTRLANELLWFDSTVADIAAVAPAPLPRRAASAQAA